MVSFRRKTAAMGYRQSMTVVGFKWRTLVVGGELQLQWLASNEGQWRHSTENDSGELKYSNEL